MPPLLPGPGVLVPAMAEEISGFQLNLFFQFFDIAGILAYTLVFAAIVLIVEAAGLRPLERRLTRWRG